MNTKIESREKAEMEILTEMYFSRQESYFLRSTRDDISSKTAAV